MIYKFKNDLFPRPYTAPVIQKAYFPNHLYLGSKGAVQECAKGTVHSGSCSSPQAGSCSGSQVS
jgi:hypothetical protein